MMVPTSVKSCTVSIFQMRRNYLVGFDVIFHDFPVICSFDVATSLVMKTVPARDVSEDGSSAQQFFFVLSHYFYNSLYFVPRENLYPLQFSITWTQVTNPSRTSVESQKRYRKFLTNLLKSAHCLGTRKSARFSFHKKILFRMVKKETSI